MNCQHPLIFKLAIHIFIINIAFILCSINNTTLALNKAKTLKHTNNELLEIKRTLNASNIITFGLKNSIKPRVFTLANPNRLVIDLPNTSLSLNKKKLKLSLAPIKKIRFGLYNKNTLRLVFDLTYPIEFKLTSPSSFQHPPTPLHKQSPYRFSVKIIEKKRFAKVKPKAISKKHLKTNNNPAFCKKIVIAIDPGHGGRDPGAKGRHTTEKALTLNIAKKLKRLINRQPNMLAVLTRNGDYYVSLRNRLKIARRYKANAFISIHADAYMNTKSHGASIFALSQSGATSEAARWLAEKENFSELGILNLNNLQDKTLLTVLLDLSQTAVIDASLKMGKSLLQSLDKITHLHNKEVEQARFMVLKSPDIISLLVEIGFISNPFEEKKLLNHRSQDYLANAILKGLKNYFDKYPIQYLTHCVKK